MPIALWAIFLLYASNGVDMEDLLLLLSSVVGVVKMSNFVASNRTASSL